MTTSIYTEKAFDKIQHPHIIKTFQKVETEGIYLNKIKAIYDKPTVIIIFKGEKQAESILRPGKRQGCSLSSILLTRVLEVQDMAIREENK